jgi:hypothetical protein
MRLLASSNQSGGDLSTLAARELIAKPPRATEARAGDRAWLPSDCTDTSCGSVKRRSDARPSRSLRRRRPTAERGRAQRRRAPVKISGTKASYCRARRWHSARSRIASRSGDGPTLSSEKIYSEENCHRRPTNRIVVVKTRRAVPGIEPGTSRARSENHTTRPNSQLQSRAPIYIKIYTQTLTYIYIYIYMYIYIYIYIYMYMYIYIYIYI